MTGPEFTAGYDLWSYRDGPAMEWLVRLGPHRVIAYFEHAEDAQLFAEMKNLHARRSEMPTWTPIDPASIPDKIITDDGRVWVKGGGVKTIKLAPDEAVTLPDGAKLINQSGATVLARIKSPQSD